MCCVLRLIDTFTPFLCVSVCLSTTLLPPPRCITLFPPPLSITLFLSPLYHFVSLSSLSITLFLSLSVTLFPPPLSITLFLSPVYHFVSPFSLYHFSNLVFESPCVQDRMRLAKGACVAVNNLVFAREHIGSLAKKLLGRVRSFIASLFLS